MKHNLLHPDLLLKLMRNKYGDIRIMALPGDASMRKYYRIIHSTGKTLIVMDRGFPFRSSEDPFLLIQIFFQQHGIPVPNIDHIDESNGLIVLEDLGDKTLQSVFLESEEEALKIYTQTLDILLRLQRDCTQSRDKSCPAFSIRFDTSKFLEELIFFKENFLEKFKGITISPTEEAILEKSFLQLAAILSKEPTVMTHRDFHSRNLMISNNRVVVIDFQDARLGLSEYDLASLLRDAYIELPEHYIESYIKEYYSAMGLPRSVWEYHRNLFGLMCLQRNLKALGTFGFQSYARGKHHYKQYIPILARHLEKEFMRLQYIPYKCKNFTITFSDLREILKKWIPEMQEESQ